jgi:hypothetical protein
MNANRQIEDEFLKGLALKAQKHPARSPARGKILLEIWNAIEGLDRLGKFRVWLEKEHIKESLYKSFKDECYNEALSRTKEEILSNIDKYNSNKATVWTWFSFLLKKRFIDVKNDFLGFRTKTIDGEKIMVRDPSLHEPLTGQNSDEDNELQTYENMGSELPKEPSDAQVLVEIIKEDSEGIFKSKHLRNNPQATFQAIALKRATGEHWEDIEEKYGDCNVFFKRYCEYFRPILGEYLKGKFYLSKNIQQQILEDKENYFKNKYIKEFKEANFYKIVLRKTEGASWKTLVTEFDNKLETKELIDFYLDCLRKYFRKNLQ